MNKYISKHFGEMNLDAAEEWYEAEIEYKGRTVTLDLYIERPKQIEFAYVKMVDDFLDSLSKYEASIRSALEKDLKERGFTHSYIEILKQEIDEEEMESLLLEADKKLRKKEQILSVIYLSRIGLYSDKGDETLAVFDYTISEDLTDELLVVNLSKEKQIQWITVES